MRAHAHAWWTVLPSPCFSSSAAASCLTGGFELWCLLLGLVRSRVWAWLAEILEVRAVKAQSTERHSPSRCRSRSSTGLFSRWKGLLCQQQPVQPAATVNTAPASALILKRPGVVSGHSDDSFFWTLTKQFFYFSQGSFWSFVYIVTSVPIRRFSFEVPKGLCCTAWPQWGCFHFTCAMSIFTFSCIGKTEKNSFMFLAFLL